MYHQHVVNDFKIVYIIMLIINTNKDIKTGRAYNTLCREVSIELKKNEEIHWKSWDG